MINVLSWLGVMDKDRFGASPIEVGILSLLMAMAVLIGRVFMAYFVSGRVSDRKLLGLCYGFSMLFFCAMLFAPSMNILYVLYFIMSFFMSAQAAATYAIDTEKLGERLAVGIPMIDDLGSLGSIVAPLVMGSLAIQVGLDRALWLVPAFAAIWKILDHAAISKE